MVYLSFVEKIAENLVKGLDDDEADFLEYVDKTKMDLERKKKLEEVKELNEFRSKMAELREQELNKHIQQELGLLKSEKKATKSYDDELPSIGTRKTTQSKLLAGIVKRKSPASTGNNSEAASSKKPRTDEGMASILIMFLALFLRITIHLFHSNRWPAKAGVQYEFCGHQ